MQFKNVSGDVAELPTLGEAGVPLRVADGETFEATGEDAKSLQTNPLFERVDKPSKTNEKE